MFARSIILLSLFLKLSLFGYSQAQPDKNEIGALIAELHKTPWSGVALVGESPTMWEFGFTEPMIKILEIGAPAQKDLLTYLKDEAIKDQIIILLGGVGDRDSVAPIIEAMEIAENIEDKVRAKKINLAANLALTNITAAEIIWHHGGGIVIEKCSDNPKECWSRWWKVHHLIFSTKDTTPNKSYSNYPNYGIYKSF